LEEDFKKEELERISQLHNNNNNQPNIQPQHSYPFRSFSPNYNQTNTMSYANANYSAGAISPSSSSSSESNHTNNINDIKHSFTSMKINRKDDI
jgi:hypothetical protein